MGLIVICYAVLLVNALLSFPDGYDPIAYHLNVALQWLQHGTLRIDPSWSWQYALPSNAELPALVALAAGMPNAVTAGNLLAAILLGLSIYLIALRMTGGTESALLSASIAVTIPMVIYQAFRLYVDLFGTAFPHFRRRFADLARNSLEGKHLSLWLCDRPRSRIQAGFLDLWRDVHGRCHRDCFPGQQIPF